MQDFIRKCIASFLNSFTFVTIGIIHLYFLFLRTYLYNSFVYKIKANVYSFSSGLIVTIPHGGGELRGGGGVEGL